jgi:LDH2 family malate/lactate/ureidoglycolate dehydrogenase
VLGGILTDGGHLGKEEKPLFSNSSLMIVLNVAVYRALPDFKRELETLIAYLKQARAAEGGGVLYPGEKEVLMEQKRRASGIPLPKATVEGLQFELDHFKLGANLLAQGKATQDAVWSYGAS